MDDAAQARNDDKNADDAQGDFAASHDLPRGSDPTRMSIEFHLPL